MEIKIKNSKITVAGKTVVDNRGKEDVVLQNVSQQRELLHKLLQHISDEDELIHNRTHDQIIDDFISLCNCG